MTQPPTPAEVLSALRLHLDPEPLLPRLPTALQLITHVGLVARAVRQQARTALAMHNEDRDPDVRGTLGVDDVRVLEQCARCDEDDGLLGLSMEMRKEHLRKSLSLRNPDLGRIQKLLDTYFPAGVSGSDKESVNALLGHPMLFISRLTAAQAGLLDVYRDEVEGWFEGVHKAQSAGTSPPILPGDANRLSKLAAKAIEVAERVVDAAAALESMFSDHAESARSSRRESLPGPARARPAKGRKSEPARVASKRWSTHAGPAAGSTSPPTQARRKRPRSPSLDR